MLTRRADVPRLIVLNGPPAIGKSTLARRYADEHPLTLNLDVDRIRGLLGGWQDNPQTAGPLARKIALAAARTHLASGYDVVVPQFLGRPGFIEQIEAVAGDVGAEFYEVALLDSIENVRQRFIDRSRLATDPAHVEAAEMLERAGGLDELSAMYDRLALVIAARPATIVIQTADGEVDRAYRDFRSSLQRR
jgi:predicted kinase